MDYEVSEEQYVENLISLQMEKDDELNEFLPCATMLLHSERIWGKHGLSSVASPITITSDTVTMNDGRRKKGFIVGRQGVLCFIIERMQENMSK